MRAVPSASLRALRGPAFVLLALSVASCHSETGPSATKLAFTVQPTATVAGTALSVTVQAQSDNGTPVTSYNGQVTITAQGPGTLSGTTVASAANGAATFSSAVLTKAGTYTLQASATGLAGATSTGFNITAASPAVLAFTIQPAANSNITAGAPITLEVTARDQYTNPAMGFTGSVEISFGANPAGGTLSGTTAMNATNGVATFAGLSINKVGAGYTLTAAAATGAPPTAATTNAFNITAGATAKLAFTVQPSNATAGSAIAPAIQVSGEDAQGNVTPSFAGDVTIAIGANPGNGTLAGTATATAANGVATFNDLSLDKPGTGYTLTASATGLTGATSATFNIAVGPLAQLVFSVEPSTAAAGAAISPAVQITGQDAAGNTATGFTGNVTVAFGNNAGNGTLGGTLTRLAVAGVATFNDLTIDKIGTGYTLNATSGGAPQVTSAAFDITPARATKLAFSVQPGNTTAGASITPAVQVKALDQFDNLDTTFTGSVTVSIATNANAGTLAGTKTVGAVMGIASFSNLSIDSAGAGYTLNVTAAGLTDALSSTFDIRPGPATHLVFRQQPSNATAGAGISPAVQVSALDAQGNVDTAYAASVTVAITPGSGTAGAHLSGSASVAAVSGVATFSGVSIDSAGTAFTFAASSGSLAGATSTTFDIIAGPATHLTFTVQPGNTAAGAAITPSIRVAAQDALGNTDLTYTTNVTLTIGNNAGGGTLTGGGPIAAVAGVATFPAASIDKVGTGYTLTAASGSLTGATSTGFDIFANTATHLVFNVEPTDAVAGVAISPAVVVQALDASNNVATGYSGAIAVSITTGTGNAAATLSGTLSVGATSGVATFSGLSIDKTADGYTLDASAGGLTGATSAAFKVTPAAATHLAFSTQPTGATAGVAIAPAVVLQALDAFDNVDTAYTANVAIAIGSNPGSGTLSGTTPIAATNGQASFSDLSINKSGTGYTLHATSGALTDVTSSPFNITSAALDHLVFTGQPSNVVAGMAIQPNVLVAGQDAFGNTVTTFIGNITVAIGTNPNSGTLSGGSTMAASNGVATFTNLSIDKAGSGYTLTATATGATAATSTSFDVMAGTASVLVFTVQPGASTTAGTAISSPITVAAQDGLGNTVAGFGGDISVAITPGTGTANATLSGTTTITPTNGMSVFSNLSIDSAGTGYTLTASATGLADGTSNAFAITAGAATKLAFTVNPVTTTAGQSIPDILVNAQDALGNTNPNYSTNIVVAITNATGTANAHLSGTLSQTPASGVATFTGLSVDSAGTNYTLTATSGGLSQAVSTGFDIIAGAATQLVFTQQPTTAVAGVPIAPTVTVAARDALGNRDLTYNSSVSIQFVNLTPATLSNATGTAASGIVSFPNLSIDKVGTGYTVQATDGAITSATSSAFNITPGPATQLVFSVEPSQVTVGAPISPAVQVTAQDANGNTATSFTSNVTIGLGSGSGSFTGSTLTMAAVAGVATFSNLKLNTPDTYTLTASTSGGVSGATSSAFAVVASTASQLFFSVQPRRTPAGQPITDQGGGGGNALEVEARDVSGQLVTSFTGQVTVAITTNTGAPGATLSGTLTSTAVAGVATFGNLSIDLAASGYKLTATDIPDGLTAATSGYFTIDPGAATHLAFTVQPTTTTSNGSITPQIEVTAQDGFNNTVTSFTNSVSLAIHTGTGASGAVLSGTNPQAAVAGVATFADLSIDLAGMGYQLDATATGVTSATSTAFEITSSAASRLVFTQQPSNTTAGQAVSPAVTLTAMDASNNVLTGFTGMVTVSITNGTGTSGATLSGTKSVAAVAGVATFSNLSIDKRGSGYRLSATTPTLSGATSSTFAISAGAATQVVFTQDPVTSTAGQTMPSIVVEGRDAFGNTDPAFTGDVTLSISSNPANGTLSGTVTRAAVAGVATFDDISIDKSGTGYRLTASSGVLASDISAAFSINGGPADHLLFTVAPSSATAGVIISPAIKVTAYDALGNVAAGFGGNVDIAITSGTGTAGAVLSGTLSQPAASGVATFADLSIDKAGSGFTLTATATTITGTASASFTISAAAAAKVGFIVNPVNTAANATITPPVQVAVQDAFGNTVTTSSASVTIAIGTDASGSTATLTGTKTVSAVNGIATFNDLSIDLTGTGYTLRATSSPLTQGESATFNIF